MSLYLQNRRLEQQRHHLTLLFVAFAFMLFGMALATTWFNVKEVHCYGMGEKVNAPDEYPVYRMDCNSVIRVLYVD